MSFLFALLAAAAAPDVPVQVQIIQEGSVFVLRSLDGAKPLYTFDRDTPGKSNCEGQCATAWPPIPAPAGAKTTGKWTVLTRPDGSGQWAYDGKPVNTFVRDAESVASGDGMGGVWHLLPTFPAK